MVVMAGRRKKWANFNPRQRILFIIYMMVGLALLANNLVLLLAGNHWVLLTNFAIPVWVFIWLGITSRPSWRETDQLAP